MLHFIVTIILQQPPLNILKMELLTVMFLKQQLYA
nr:MAG TPA: hypothetical protein [Caudoviricetes sp.]